MKRIIAFVLLLEWRTGALACPLPPEHGQARAPVLHSDGTRAAVEQAIKPTINIDSLRALGPGVMPILASIYSESSESERVALAETFYGLGWKSPEAKAALLRDIETQNPTLRLPVQWALGYRSIELRNIPADGDFPELQGEREMAGDRTQNSPTSTSGSATSSANGTIARACTSTALSRVRERVARRAG